MFAFRDGVHVLIKMMAEDMELVREYAARQSEKAFETLVSRHIHLVYSVALRQTSDPHLAEEVTQSVFILLARKAKLLGAETILTGWLYRTAQYVSADVLKMQRRRQRREQEAYMQSTLNEPLESQAWQQIAPMLDSAMLRLGEKDRNAVLLRFFEGKDFKQVGAALGANEDGARMRVNRALEKLRQIFLQRGADSTTAAIAETISIHSIQPAPAALIKTTAALALAKGATASLPLTTIAKATLITMKTKIIIATAVAVIIGAGAGFVIFKSISGPPLPPPEKLPLKFANDAFRNGVDDDRFEMDTDPNMRRTPDSDPAIHIKSLIAPATDAEYLASTTGKNRLLAASRYTVHWLPKNSLLLGKRVQVGGWIKTKDVAAWAGASLEIVNKGGHIFADDDMTDRPIRGTTDWQQIEFVADVPKEPCAIVFAPALYGTGEVWFDDFEVDVVPPETPITDDRPWHVWSPDSYDYSETTDDTVTHNGHSAFCIEYTLFGKAPPGSWMWWGQDIRTPEKYAGHMVRMTVWTKTENVDGRLRPNLRPKGANFKLLAQDKMLGGGPISGTTDWTLRTITCRIPKDTECLDTGFAFHGSGKVWLDLDSLKYEIIDNPTKPELIEQ